MLNNVNFLYLTLLKQALTRALSPNSYETIPRNTKTPLRAIRSFVYEQLNEILSVWNLALVQTNRPTGETMIGMGALENLEKCVCEVLNNKVPGDFCETGVWRGGACIFMKGILEVYNETTRQVWLADSFEGLPKPDSVVYPDDKDSRLWEQSLAVSLEEVKQNFIKYNLLDDKVKFIKGFFSDTMPNTTIEKLAILRLDGDMYESTIVVLRNLYPKLSVGGYVIIDDYGMIPGCNKAVEDFRLESGIKEELQIIGYVNDQPLGAYWKRTS